MQGNDTGLSQSERGERQSRREWYEAASQSEAEDRLSRRNEQGEEFCKMATVIRMVTDECYIACNYMEDCFQLISAFKTMIEVLCLSVFYVLNKINL